MINVYVFYHVVFSNFTFAQDLPQKTLYLFQSFNEEDTAEHIKRKQTKKETKALHEISSEGRTLKERQGKVKNVVKERRKCNNTERTICDVFYSVNNLSVIIFSLFKECM